MREGEGRRREWLRALHLLPLLVLGGVCLVLVALAAHHASFLSPTGTARHFPGWMSGPLSGLWPGPVPAEHALHLLTSGLLGLLFLAYLLVLREARHTSARWMIGAILAINLLFLLGPPLQDTDVFNYINYGRMGVVHHLNPYAVLPLHEPHSDPAYPLSNWHYLRSPYGPLFTLLTYALVPLGIAASLWVIKLIVIAASLGLLALVWRLARLLGRPPQLAVAFVGLNPIVMFWGLGGLHNDFIMMFLVFAAVYLLLAPRLRGEQAAADPLTDGLRAILGDHDLIAGVLLVAAVGIKASAAIFLPIALVMARRRGRLIGGVAGAGALLIGASLAAFGANLGGVSAQSSLVSPEGLPNLLGIALGQGGETAALKSLLSGLAVAAILLAAARARSRPGQVIGCLCVTALALILTLGWSAPWYVLWVLPFAALAASARWRTLVLIYTLYALIASSPNVANIERALHFYPRSDRLGRQHVREFDHLAAV